MQTQSANFCFQIVDCWLACDRRPPTMAAMNSVAEKSAELPLRPSFADLQAERALGVELVRRQLLTVNVREIVPLLAARHVLRSSEMGALYSLVSSRFAVCMFCDGQKAALTAADCLRPTSDAAQVCRSTTRFN